MLSKRIMSGIYAGLAGGVVFGLMMTTMGMMPMIGKMIGQPTLLAGWIVHLLNSAMIGAGFAVVLGRRAESVGGGLRWGLAYGGVWWLLGPMTLMPLFLGMGFGVNWNAAAAVKMFPSFIGHLVYGTILGVGYSMLLHRAANHQPSRSQKVATVKGS